MSSWEKIDPAKATILPASACVYAIYVDNELVYIGSTVNLRARFREHRIRYSYGRDTMTPWGDSENVYAKVSFSRRYGDWVMRELRLIRRLLPPGNSRSLGRPRLKIAGA